MPKISEVIPEQVDERFVELATNTTYLDNMDALTLNQPSAENEWDVVTREIMDLNAASKTGSIVVYKSGSSAVAVGLNGKIVSQGTAGTSDGVVNDDATVLQAASNAVTGGGRVLISGTWYLGSTTITVPRGVIWEGIGNNPVTGSLNGSMIRYTGVGSAIYVTDAATTRRRGGFNGLRLINAGVSTVAVGIELLDVSDFIIENSNIGNFGVNVKVTDSSAVYLDRSYLFGAKDTSLYLNGSSDCWVIQSQCSGSNYGVHAIDSSSLQLVSSRLQSSGKANVRVEDTGFFNMVGGLCDSADLDPGANEKNGLQLHNVSNVRVTGVQFYANGTDADVVLTADSGDTMKSVSFVGNVFEQGGGSKKAILIPATQSTMKKILVTGNIVDNDSEPLLSIAAPTGAGSISEVSIAGNVAPAGCEGLSNITDLLTTGNVEYDGGRWFSLAAATATHTLTKHQRTVRTSPTTNQTINLPAAADRYAGMRIVIKRSNATADAVTVDGNGANIDGAATYTGMGAVAYASATFEWDNNLGRWHLVATANI